ncbi:MAG: putative membrane protein [Paraglaciecola sp.]|jgi:uncharacterized membrane protein
MMFKKLMTAYFTTLFTVLILDGLWLGIVAKDTYRQAIGHVMRSDIPTWPWVLFYLSYAAAIIYLIVSISSSIKQTAIRGAVLGIAAYGAYNLTNYSLIVDWPLGITLQDWLWGTFITCIGATTGGIVWRKYE